jgi:hypothetical protein
MLGRESGFQPCEVLKTRHGAATAAAQAPGRAGPVTAWKHPRSPKISLIVAAANRLGIPRPSDRPGLRREQLWLVLEPREVDGSGRAERRDDAPLVLGARKQGRPARDVLGPVDVARRDARQSTQRQSAPALPLQLGEVRRILPGDEKWC